MQEFLTSSIPSVFCGLFLWYIKRHFDKRDKEHDEKDKARIKKDVLVLKAVSASLELGEATAEAIKTNRCNGVMEEARIYATQVNHEIKDFMYQQGSEYLS